jgi:hypothetical protein
VICLPCTSMPCTILIPRSFSCMAGGVGGVILGIPGTPGGCNLRRHAGRRGNRAHLLLGTIEQKCHTGGRIGDHRRGPIISKRSGSQFARCGTKAPGGRLGAREYRTVPGSDRAVPRRNPGLGGHLESLAPPLDVCRTCERRCPGLPACERGL